MSRLKKRPSGSPVPKSAKQLLANKVFKRLAEGVELTKELQEHVTPMGDSLITLEQWRYLRGSVINDMTLYAQLTGKPSPIDIIVKSEQERVLVDI